MDMDSQRPTEQRRQTIGELFFGVSARDLVRAARAELEAGDTEEAVRARIIERANASGLSVSRVLFPMLNRKMRRSPLHEFAHRFVDELLASKPKQTVGDGIGELSVWLGFDEWLANGVLHMAKTGETSPMIDFATGKVMAWDMGKDGGPGGMTVWAVATPHSDPRDLARQFRDKCVEVFPEWTWSRYSTNTEAARYLSRRLGGASYESIAEEEIGVDELSRLVALGPLVRKARVDQEVDRIRKLCDRFIEYLDSFDD